MDDLISRSDAIRIASGYCHWSNIPKELEKLPSVSTEKTGQWIDDEFGSKCSCCGIHTHLDKFDRPMKFRHCSMCGAKMKGVEE